MMESRSCASKFFMSRGLNASYGGLYVFGVADDGVKIVHFIVFLV